MTPGARAQAVIDLLDSIFPLEADAGGDRGMPPDRLFKKWVRKNRYAGSKDRRAIQTLFYDVLRGLGPLLRGFGDKATPRLCVAAVLKKQSVPEEVFTGANYAPQPFSPAELDVLEGSSIDWAQPNFPSWIVENFSTAWGDRANALMTSLNKQAAVDVRVNARLASKEQVITALLDEGIDVAPVPWCQTALRLIGSVKIDQSQAFADGWIEVQDAGSQMVSLLAASSVGENAEVLDFCAGAGGKTLALIDQLTHPKKIIASDIDGKRLSRMTSRLCRIGNPEVALVPQTPKAINDWASKFDLVLVDAPCSGSGAWARDPLSAWQLSPDMFEGLLQTQSHVLDRASGCVKPGGKLVYVTCSLFEQENVRQAFSFLERHQDFEHLLPSEDALKEIGLAQENVANGQLLITPDRALTGSADGMTSDGFFVAMFKRKG